MQTLALLRAPKRAEGGGAKVLSLGAGSSEGITGTFTHDNRVYLSHACLFEAKRKCLY